MPHLKCAVCKARLYSAASPADVVGDRCPDCASLLEPVYELAEIVGFRLIKPRDADARGPGTQMRTANSVDGFQALREALAVALPAPEENP